MGDTRRSQTISTENREIAEDTASSGPVMSEAPQEGDPPWFYGESSVARIRMLAKSCPDLVFTSLAHRIDFHMLRKSFGEVRKSKSAGVDRVTAEQYAVNLAQLRTPVAGFAREFHYRPAGSALTGWDFPDSMAGSTHWVTITNFIRLSPEFQCLGFTLAQPKPELGNQRH